MCLQKLQKHTLSSQSATARLIALTGVPLVRQDDDLAGIILSAVAASNEQLHDADIVVIAQKIVSKAEGRLVREEETWR